MQWIVGGFVGLVGLGSLACWIGALIDFGLSFFIDFWFEWWFFVWGLASLIVIGGGAYILFG